MASRAARTGSRSGTRGGSLDPRVQTAFDAAGQLFTRLARQPDTRRQVVQIAEAIIGALRGGGRVFFFGNGGSASQSQHLAAELVGRFHHDRRPLAAIALTENTASLTAISNDYSYEVVFARQIEGLGRKGDVAIGLSTSGRSANIVAALAAARKMGMTTVGLTAGEGGIMRSVCDICVRVPAESTPRIQEAHLLIGHTVCELVDHAFLSRRA